MAITLKQSGTSTGGSGTSRTPALGVGATAGNLLVAGVVVSSSSAGFTTPTGWTLLHHYQASGALNFAFYYRVSDGTETNVTMSWVNTLQSNAFIAEYEGWTGTPTLDQSAENETNLASATTSCSSGSITTTQAACLLVAAFGSDSYNNVDGGRAYSDSFAERVAYNSGSGTRPGIFLADREVSSTGTYDTTFSTTDGGDEMYGAIAAFYSAGGGGITGDAAIAEAADTVASAGVVSVAGTAAVDEASDTASGGGAVAIAGVAALTEAADTAAATGAVAVTGQASVGEGSDTLAGSGAVTSGPTGAGNITEGNDTAGGTGVVVVSGSGAIVEEADGLAGAGVGVSGTPATVVDDPFALYRRQGRAFADRHFPTTVHSGDIMKLYQRLRRGA